MDFDQWYRAEAQRIEEDYRREDEERRKWGDRAQESVASIQDIRKEIETLAAKLQEESHSLRVWTRRTASVGDVMSGYLAFANAHLRLSGAVLQGLRRTVSVDRSLEIRKVEDREHRRRSMEREQERLLRDRKRHIDQLSVPRDDAFGELYGDVLDDDQG